MYILLESLLEKPDLIKSINYCQLQNPENQQYQLKNHNYAWLYTKSKLIIGMKQKPSSHTKQGKIGIEGEFQ